MHVINIKKISFPVAAANYYYLINKPKSEKNLIDLIAISFLEEKYPNLIKLKK